LPAFSQENLMTDERNRSDSAFEEYLRRIPKKAGGPEAEIFLLSCIDYRFFTIIAEAMRSEGWEGKYDHFILAGASLGALLDFNADHLPDPKPLLPRMHWQQLFVEHLQIATSLHQQIHTVILLEHRDCGAHKTFLRPGGYTNPDEEKAEHKRQADKLERLILRVRPGLSVTKWLASLGPPGVGPLDASRGIGQSPTLDIEQL
jgi:hypothetical protein